MSAYQIRRMQACDTAAVARLEKACFSSPWSETSLAAELENPLSLWLVAEQDGALCGYIGSQAVPPEADVMNLAVEESCRGRGIAESLCRQLMQALRLQGVEALFLEVRASNAPALALYAKLGFAEVGRRRNYYRAPAEDALILKRKLKEGEK